MIKSRLLSEEAIGFFTFDHIYSIDPLIFSSNEELQVELNQGLRRFSQQFRIWQKLLVLLISSFQSFFNLVTINLIYPSVKNYQFLSNNMVHIIGDENLKKKERRKFYGKDSDFNWKPAL